MYEILIIVKRVLVQYNIVVIKEDNYAVNFFFGSQFKNQLILTKRKIDVVSTTVATFNK